MTTVVLTITQKVTYRKEFEIPDAVYAEIQDKLNTLRGHDLMIYEERVGETYIDFMTDWFDADDTEITSFEEVKP